MRSTSSSGKSSSRVLIAVVGEYRLGFTRASEALHQTEVERLRLQSELAAGRLQLLQAQIEPHFLFNSLANVRRLLRTDGAAGRTMLADLLRYLESACRACATSARRSSARSRSCARSSACIRCAWAAAPGRVRRPADLGQRVVPPMMLLTLVENALKHGCSRCSKAARSASAQSRPTSCALVETPAAAWRPAGPGSTNIRARLRAMYGAGAALAARQRAARRRRDDRCRRRPMAVPAARLGGGRARLRGSAGARMAPVYIVLGPGAFIPGAASVSSPMCGCPVRGDGRRRPTACRSPTAGWWASLSASETAGHVSLGTRRQGGTSQSSLGWRLRLLADDAAAGACTAGRASRPPAPRARLLALQARSSRSSSTRGRIGELHERDPSADAMLADLIALLRAMLPVAAEHVARARARALRVAGSAGRGGRVAAAAQGIGRCCCRCCARHALGAAAVLGTTRSARCARRRGCRRAAERSSRDRTVDRAPARAPRAALRRCRDAVGHAAAQRRFRLRPRPSARPGGACR